VEEIGFWAKTICLVIAVIFLAHVGWHALPFDNPRADLIGLNLAEGGLKGTISSLTYFQEGNQPDGTKIAISQRNDAAWTLQVLNPDNENMPLFKVPAGDDEFRSLFVQKGRYLLIDKVKNGRRGLWKVNAINGTSAPLNVENIQPIEDGQPWSEKNGQLLYVTQGGGNYDLKALTLATGKSKTLLSSHNPIHTPSWVNVENPDRTPSWSDHDEEIAYADGVNGLFWVLDSKTNQRELLKSDLERMQGEKFAPAGTVLKVIPSPDGFRYLYLSKIGDKNIISLVRSDGTRRDQVYETKCSIGAIAWHPDSQQIVFEEKHEGLWQNMDLGFMGSFTNIKLLDGNLGTVVNLIPAQLSNHAPALSTDGAKIAFVSGDGLWYPSLNQGIWVALLR
jgi:Tol biopolymer transport system component